MDLQDKVWCRLSEEARSLVAALLEKDPRKRITADEALQHPWMLAVRACDGLLAWPPAPR